MRETYRRVELQMALDFVTTYLEKRQPAEREGKINAY